MRRKLLCGVGVAMLALFGAVVAPPQVGPASGRAADGSWVLPVDGPVVRGFDPPRTRYGPGHRGVDFSAAPGTPVVAAGAGVVVFVGRIGPSSHVVVLHPVNGWRTGYSFLETVTVRVGERVAGGTVVGTSGGTGDGHDGRVLHFSLRIGDDYVDPMMLFQPLDLGAVVHLAPTASDSSGIGFGAAPWPRAVERAGLLAGVRIHHGSPGARTLPRQSRLAHWRWF